MDRFSTDTKQENYWTHTGCIENFGRNERLPVRSDQYKNALQWRSGGLEGRETYALFVWLLSGQYECAD